MHTYGSWEGFLFCSPICPKQPRTSFPFYKFFYPTVPGRISDHELVRQSLRLNFLETLNFLNCPLLHKICISSQHFTQNIKFLCYIFQKRALKSPLLIHLNQKMIWGVQFTSTQILNSWMISKRKIIQLFHINVHVSVLKCVEKM